MDITGTTIEKTVADLVKSDDALKESSKIFGMLFPYAGKRKKAADMYITDIENSDLPIETKILLVLDIKKKFKEIKNQGNIVDVAMNNAKPGTDFSEKSGVSEEWLDRFMDSARFVCAEDVQLIWGKILANEFERPNSTPPNMIRILSEITPDLAKAFSLICKMEIWIVILDYKDDVEKVEKMVCVPLINSSDELYEIGIDYDILSELETLGLVRFKTTTGFAIQGVMDEKILVSAGGKIDVIENNKKGEIPLGNIRLTTAGEALRSIMHYDGEGECIENYFEKVKEYMIIKGIGFAAKHDYSAELKNDRIEIKTSRDEYSTI